MLSPTTAMEWSWYHTACLLIIRCAGDSLVRSVAIFDYALAEWLNVTISEFSSVLLIYYIGNIVATFFAIINEKYGHDSLQVFQIYRSVSGVASIVFGLPFLISQLASYNLTFLLLYLSIVWFVYSISFIIGNYVEINIATEYNKSSNRGKIVSLLSASWTITSLFYVIEGYIVDYFPGEMYLVLGVLLAILPSIIKSTCFAFNQSNENDGNANGNGNGNDDNYNHILLKPSWLKANSGCALVFLATFMATIASGSSDVIVNPILMDVYGLTATQSGYASMSMALGEIMATVLLTKYSDKWGNYTMVSIAMIVKMITGVLLLIISVYDINGHGHSSLYVFIVVIALWYFSWELFWVSQLFGIFKYVETKNNTPEKILLLTLGLFASVGRIVGTFITAYCWDFISNDNDNHKLSMSYISLLWIISSVFAAIIYIIIYITDENRKRAKNKMMHDLQNQNSPTTFDDSSPFLPQ